MVGDTEPEIRSAVGSGQAFGLKVTYIQQSAPLGLAHAVLVARDFLGDDDFVMYLGDNFIVGGITELVEEFRASRPDAPPGEAGDPRQTTSTSAVSFVLTVGTSRPSGLGRRFGCGGGRLELGAHRVGLEIEIGVTVNPVLVQPVLSAGAEHAEAVPDAPAQVDRR